MATIEFDVDEFSFGTEVEYSGVTREKSAKVIAEVLGGTTRYRGGGYHSWEITDPQGRIWKIVSDSSVQVTGGGEQCEFVSPPLHYHADMPILQECIRALRRAGGKPNSSTGVHVHVGAEKHTPQTLRNLANIVKSKESLLIQALAVNPSRMRYCRRIDEDFISRINKDKPQTMEKFADEVYEKYGGYEYNRHQHYSSSRYQIVNFHSYYYNDRKTIEFRLFNFPNRPDGRPYGLHGGWIRTFVLVGLGIHNMSIKQKTASSKPTETTNAKYSFRVWLLRMGFIGEEFEVPRRLLMENLEGNMAWRYGAPTTSSVRSDADNENN